MGDRAYLRLRHLFGPGVLQARGLPAIHVAHGSSAHEPKVAHFCIGAWSESLGLDHGTNQCQVRKA